MRPRRLWLIIVHCCNHLSIWIFGNLSNVLAELSDMLDRLATFGESVLLTSDINIRLERSTDPTPASSLTCLLRMV